MARSFGRSLAGGLASAYLRSKRAAQREKQRLEWAYQKEQFRIVLKAQKEQERAELKAQKEKYFADRKTEAIRKSGKLLASYEKYTCLINKAYTIEKVFNFESYKKEFKPSIFEYNEPFPQKPIPNLKKVPKESIIEKIFPSITKKRLLIIESNQQKEKQSENEYQSAIVQYNERKNAAQSDWEQKEIEQERFVEKHNLEIDEWRDAYITGDGKAIKRYLDEIFKANEYSEGTLQDYLFIYNQYGKQLIIDIFIKDKEKVFFSNGYKYIKKIDDFEPTKMTISDMNERMKTLLAQVTIATFIILFKNDPEGVFKNIVVNAYGNDICGASVQVNKDEFENVDFNNEDDVSNFIKIKARIYKQASKGIKPFETRYIELT